MRVLFPIARSHVLILARVRVRCLSQGRVDYVRDFGTGRRFVSAPNMFLALRATLFLLMFSVLVWSFSAAVIDHTAAYWPIYFTNWTLIIEIVYLGCALYTTASLRRQVLQGLEEDAVTPGLRILMPWNVQITWMLQAIALPASFLVINSLKSFLWQETL